MKNDQVYPITITDEKPPKSRHEDEVSPIFPKILKFSDTGDGAEIDFLNNSIQSNEYIYNPNNKSELSIKYNNLENESNFSVSKAPNVSCKRHGRKFLGVDTTKFKLICKKCVEQNIKIELSLLSNNVSLENSLLNLNIDEECFCNFHSYTNSTFYCDDCSKFICEECEEKCKNHNINLPSYMPILLRDKFDEIFSSFNKIKPELDENLEIMIKANQIYRKLRENSNKIVKDKISILSDTTKLRLDNLQKKFNEIFQGMDQEMLNLYTRLLTLQKKSQKYLTEIKNISSEFLDDNIWTKLSNLDLIKLLEKRKINSQLYIELKNLKNDSENFMLFKIPKLKKEVNSKLEIWNKEVNFFMKNVLILENSIKSTISNGCKNNSIILKRFPKYSRKGMRFFKTSSIVIEVEREIYLSGLGLCGLYISSFKTADYNSPIYKNLNDRGKIPIEIIISLTKQGNEAETSYELKLLECTHLFGVVNRVDPNYLIYFQRAMIMKKDHKYTITIKNNDNNSIIDLWTGEVNMTSKKEMSQSITCNVNSVKFNFSPAHGIESDLNEFNMGIISSLIYQISDN
jgi:hypothetical protein